MCRIAAGLFLLAALTRAVALVVPLAIWGSPAIEIHCGDQGCRAVEHPQLMLPAPMQAAVAVPSAATAFGVYSHRPLVRAGLAAIGIAECLPFVLLMLCVSGALWRLGARGPNDLARAIPWLRGASFAALAYALVPPFAASLRAMLLFPGTPSGPMWYLELDFGPFLLGLLLATAAFAVSWAITAGSRAEADIAEIV